MIRKIFAYILRMDDPIPHLLVVESHAEIGKFEVVRGKADPDDGSVEFTARRETFEEAGIDIDALVFLKHLGVVEWHGGKRRKRVEEQHGLVLRAPDGLPEAWEYICVSSANDNGRRFVYRWLPVEPDLERVLIEGCDKFIPSLISFVLNKPRV